MVFSSVMFLFLFLPASLACYFLIPRRLRSWRNFVLLAFSLAFYCYGEPRGIFVMLVSILGNYLFACAIESFAPRRTFLTLSVIFNIAILGYFKYTGFFLENINAFFGADIAVPQIVMPIGISFFTFQAMSYVFDVYRREVPAQKNPATLALYISLFPQLVAGPIVRYSTVADELSSRQESMTLAASGFRRLIVGLAKKMLLANTMGLIASDIFAMAPAELPTATAWLGAVAYSFQIFFDFSAYSDMAIGLGRIFGFHFLENFDYPYISKSITEFWRRWHMSLGTWFRDYVYVPLGGNRRGIRRQLFNILVVWVLTGFWHGAAWNFVVWGLYFAVILIAEKLFLGKLLTKIPKFFAHIYSLILIIVGWVIFNSQSLDGALSYLGCMFSWRPLDSTAKNQLIYTLMQYRTELILCAVLSTPAVRAVYRKFCKNAWFELLCSAALILLFVVSVLSVVSTTFNPFIYFRF